MKFKIIKKIAIEEMANPLAENTGWAEMCLAFVRIGLLIRPKIIMSEKLLKHKFYALYQVNCDRESKSKKYSLLVLLFCCWVGVGWGEGTRTIIETFYTV